ncbi:DNA-directed RNA polymerase III subunit rpc1 [Auxenochlorella protothecoides]|uniref:DNA-directed RNA polymerase subunit n=1 Tax=Auxenochlorella protothecoides TaxID=3075 RepID=A0A087SLP5_AUXPR|nr:DNA-directed RNA polymerase III subunit rpc1 [Auxenochlorella protothecoides]KFM26649.1 DNA-directed RNA polymerase III subunit rpc1 [Auxenochlorella protothecoides]
MAGARPAPPGPAERSKLCSSKESYEEPNVPRRIKQLRFSLMSPSEIIQTSEMHVYERALYKMPERRPQPNGVLDGRLGVSNKRAICETCGQHLSDCTGHFGYIKLELPVFHIGYLKNTVQILQCVCKTCSRVLLPAGERSAFLRRFRSLRTERVQREAVFKRVLDRCKRTKLCPHCGAENGVVKKVTGTLKIIHDPFTRNKGRADVIQDDLAMACQYNDQLRGNLARVMDDLNPLRVRQLFTNIPQADLELLDVAGRPEDLLISAVPVPPVCIRPSVEMDAGAGSNEDDITMRLANIVETNATLRQDLAAGAPASNLMEHWDYLQFLCATVINSDLPGLSAMYQTGGAKPTRGLVQRLKGKQGRFRGNLSGKRVDFSGRTVISPDPNLRVSEVCVPRLMALTLTYPERVTAHNMEKLKQRVLAGASHWPGASFVIFPNGDKVFLRFGDRRRIASELKIGDIVERHLEDGDIVLFNRQPSLHRMSIMAHRARVMPWRTLRFNECVCSPYNADFDGDEMNIHVPQTEEARAEALQLMGVVNNLCTPKNGEILVAATQDFLTSAYLLTSKDKFFTRPKLAQALAYLTDNRQDIELPPPAIVKPLELWTGKQVFTMLLRPNSRVKLFVSLETAEKIYTKQGQHMCPADGYVCFHNSHLICGRLGKVTLGGGNKAGLFQVLMADYSAAVAAEAMSRLAKLSARFIGDQGFSIGIDDVTPAPELQRAKAATLAAGYGQCDDFIAAYGRGKLALQPGCNAEESLEASVTGVLNNIREQAAKVCMASLHPLNSPLIMSQCGSKGSPINIAQMVACVGQQSVGGKRTPNGFTDRSLPHFPRGDCTPAGKGFVANSFYSGLTPTEFFFHTMAGREGLVDTAVKTAETGYMSRRLMKALEDLYAHYDGTVRNAAGGVVQLQYGEDGMDPVGMEGKDGEPVAFQRVLALIKATGAGAAGRAGGAGMMASSAASGGVASVVQASSGGAHDGAQRDASEAATGEAERDASAAAQGTGHGATHDATGSPRRPREGGEGAAKEEIAAPGARLSTQACPLPAELEAAVAQVLGQGTFGEGSPFSSAAFRDRLATFLAEQVAALRAARARLGLPADARGAGHLEHLVRVQALTREALAGFVAQCAARYERKRIEPGATVGAFGAQSIGEPGTQMTLKTFHFAGVASMNVTLGVPRLKEIINAAKNISTPLMQVALSVDGSEQAARIVKGRLERTRLGGVAASIRIMLKPSGSHVQVRLDMENIHKLQLGLNASTVKLALMEAPKLKLKAEHILTLGEDQLEVRPPLEPARVPVLFQLQTLENALPGVIVRGIPTVERAVINKKQGGGFNLLVEGTNLAAVMGTPGVAGLATRSNHVAEVVATLGIEAARATVMEEIAYTMGQHGMAIDARHTMLLADCMTARGEVLGITRFGIAKMKDSVLMLASFEKTTDHLFDAALHGRVDDITGVSESIIMGIPMPTGTGLMKVLQRAPPGKVLARRPAPLLA